MTQETAQLLQLQHISADFYHAGLSSDERGKRQEAWLQNQTRVIVCTNAFGMGIDKPDVRVVIHHDMPDCLENYYQEAGRAGRDGQKSYAVLLYEEKDLTDLANASAIRFPSIAEVKKVYQCLVNYLQLPSGSGELLWMDFDLQDFVRTFKLNMHTAVYALKTLEQEGWINYAEQIFLPAKVIFNASKDRIAEFELQHPQLEPFIKALLRNYGGIFDMESFISEKQLVSIVKTDLENIKQALLQLHQYGIIHYSPQKDNAQLQFSENRPAVDDLFINPHNRLQRKEQFELRIKAMLNYVNNESNCRSKIIGNYFGDETIVDCSVCDVCLRKKGNDLTTEEFERIRLFLTEKASGNGVVLKDLLTKMGSKQKERVWKVIDHLVAEEKITLSKEGLMKMK